MFFFSSSGERNRRYVLAMKESKPLNIRHAITDD
jgi:hypothetical protein